MNTGDDTEHRVVKKRGRKSLSETEQEEIRTKKEKDGDEFVT